ncbi:MAG: AAA family ATPase [Kofleriaceae bacterium]
MAIEHSGQDLAERKTATTNPQSSESWHASGWTGAVPETTLWDDGDLVLVRDHERLTLVPSSQQPGHETIARLERAFALREDLDATWALRPIELVRRDGRPNLVLTDPGGVVVASRTWSFTEALEIACGIASAVRQLHERRLIHKHLRPSHMLTANGRVWLSGFGRSSRGTSEPPPSEPMGEVAYLAPEQTGRVDRNVDARTDLYAAGLVIYELLAGARPFTASTPAEWIHCHVARTPAALPAHVPAQTATIVMKLLAKMADDRYQSAAGLEHDLLRCLQEWKATGTISRFVLGARDHGRRLIISERLYGRTDASRRLAAALDRVRRSSAELILISGYSGIGKSALVADLVKSLESVRIGFGKFDQYKRDIPYATLAEALQSLVREILRGSDTELERWRASLQEALGQHGDVLARIVPELGLLLGPQPSLGEVSVEESRHRFQLVIQRVLSVFARPEHPLVLFLDDLQWADRATLDLLRFLLGTGMRHLLVVGAYRDNEVPAAHPLLRTVEDIKRAGAPASTIVLEPLPVAEVAAFIADALLEVPTRVDALAQLVHAKTGGNPFFVIQFLLALRDDGLLWFDDAWRWDLPRIVARGFTDNLAEFMVGKISRLGAETRDVLKHLACVGRSCDAELLARVIGISTSELEVRMWPALHAGLVVDAYSFPHDRVREASYALTTELERARIHLQIARLYDRDEQLFEVANHFNAALAVLDDSTERELVAEINLAASRRAASAIAFASAVKYAISGLAAVGDNRALDFALTLQRANCEYLIGEPSVAAERLTELAARDGLSLIDRAQVTCLRAAVHTTLNQSEHAITLVLEQLREFGITWTREPSEAIVRAEYDQLCARLPPSGPIGLVDLPIASDEWRACMDVLLALEPAAVFVDKALHDIGVMRMANLSIEHGCSDASPLGFAEVAMVLWPRFGARSLGFQFGELGLALVEKRGILKFAGRVFNVVGHHVMPWRGAVAHAVALERRALAITIEQGDLVFRLFSLTHIVVLALAAGEPLDDIQREAEIAVTAARKAGFELIVQCMLGLLGLIEGLRGVKTRAAVDARLFEDPGLAIAACWYWIRQSQLRVYDGDFRGAVEAVEHATPLMWTTPTFFERAEYTYFAALAYAGVADREKAALHYETLVDWLRDGPDVFASREALVAAELARLDGRFVDAELGYERALELTRTHGLVHEEGLVHEIAARCYDARGLRTSAQAFRMNARACYERWGAYGRVRELDRLHRGLSTSSTTALRHLDVATVLEISHAVSSELVLDRLVERLMRIVVEYAGATRGMLLDGRRIEAEIHVEERQIAMHAIRKELDPRTLPETMVNYVTRTQQIVNLDDATKPNAFSTDPYLVANHLRSVLCFPLVRHGGLVALLYLENTHSSHAFTDDRIAILRVIASQAAISLENARLYQQRQRAKIYLDRAQSLSHTGSFGWNIDAGTIEWSEEAYQIYGYDPGIVATPQLVLDRIHPGDLDRITAQLTHVLANVEDYTSAFRILMPDGAIKYVQIEAVAVDRTPGQREYIGAIMDVTHREAFRELRAAKEATEAASKAKDEFLANVSHEIRTPMNAVLGMTELVLESQLTSDQRQWLESVKNAGDSLLVIIDDLLDFSKIESGTFALRREEFGLRRELVETLRGHEIRANRKNVRLSSRVGDTVPERLIGDVGRWRQIVTNLVGNAVKFTSAGSIEVGVDVISSTDRVIELALSVRDTGIGIPADKQQKIFEAFAQQDTSTTRVYGGTGLGLTIASRLASLMGGKIAVTSEVGVGSTFTCTVRFDLSRSHAVARKTTGEMVVQERLRVLVAEDNELNALLIREMLERRGHHVEVARTGTRTLELSERYDLLLLDIHMPELDGYEVIARIRQNERGTNRHLPVIALTASSRQEDRDRCLAAGMDAFIGKPIQGANLAATIARVTAKDLEYIDAATLIAACDGDAGVYERVRDALQIAVPAEVAVAASHLTRGDLKAARETAHRLYGMISATSSKVAAIASELEDYSATGDLDDARDRLTKLQELVPLLMAELARTPFIALDR